LLPEYSAELVKKKNAFRFKIIHKRIAILESKRIVEWRCLYLQAIKKNIAVKIDLYYLKLV
jgi:hypothetical protein